MVISLKMFQECIKHIEETLEKDNKLTEILLDKDTYGWITTAPDLVHDNIKLLSLLLEDKDEWIEWYLWEREDGRCDNVYITDDETKVTTKYTIKDTEDLYNLIINNLKDIKTQEESEEPKEYNIVNEAFKDGCVGLEDLLQDIFNISKESNN